MQELAAGKITVKKSQFYAHLYVISKTEDISKILSDHHTRYNKANHHCYGLRISSKEQGVITDFSDDGEVGRPGRVLLQVLKHHDLSHHAIVVSRIFGGIKLGVGGVSRAFRKAAEGVVSYHQQS